MADAHALQVLEYQRVFSAIKQLARSDEGRQSLEKQPLLTNPEELQAIQQEAKCFQQVLLGSEYPLMSYPAIAAALDEIKVAGSLLEGEQCVDIARYIENAASEQSHLLAIKDEKVIEDFDSALLDRVTRINVPEEVSKTVRQYFDGAGNLKEDSIPSLKGISSRIQRAKLKARDVAYRFLRGSSDSEIWTSQEPALRDGRLVLPLQENFRGRIDGVVHARSSSGNTLFMEPGELLEANNEISNCQAEYFREVQRILRLISDVIFTNREDIIALQQEVAWLDDRCARARYGLAIKGCWIRPAKEAAVRLVQARHPLLAGKAVPVGIEVGECRIMVLSGPNAGGKTVALKTLGICSLLHQHGFPVPAAEGSTLPIFSGIFADIGDEQSIDFSLSTFSGHVARVSDILSRLDHASLVLLDELGTGTDPEEAGAIALAVCEYLKSSGCISMITTHLWILKEFAYVDPVCINAAMSYNEDLHLPEYQMITGLPGNSCALDLAEKSGLPSSVVKRAQKIHSDGQSNSAALLSRLLKQQEELQHQQQKISEEQQRLQLLEQELLLQKQQLLSREKDVRQGKLNELDSLLAEARRKIEGVVKRLREGVLTSEQIKDARDSIDLLANQAAGIRQQAEHDVLKVEEQVKTILPKRQAEFSPGMRVRFVPNNKEGRIIRSAGKQRWQIETGSIKLTVDENQIEALLQEASKKTATGPDYHQMKSRFEYPEMESNDFFCCDLRGMRVLEAEKRMQQFLDAAMVRGASNVEILHGKGTGALQQMVHDVLSDHHGVKSFQFASPEAGGSGKTEVLLAG
ncbi:MAG: hypothetical protein D6B26_07940 [Spirochaetaceae bacterium]|nr:MAG: hypothetical protein D6B26_07940 [Spirochaetaceae bacterium]